ncbi:MAG: M20/M25/M40 family metallo-hydrolase [Terriglobales bacterium]
MKTTSRNGADVQGLTAAFGRYLDPAWLPVRAHFDQVEPWTTRQQIALTAVASPTHAEGLRAEWMLRQFRELGLEAGIDEVGNVVAERASRDPSLPLVALTAHLDTAFAPGTPVQPEWRQGRIWAPGISDNGAGLAALLALARTLQDWNVATEAGLLFVANVGEEGEGDLRGMRHLFRPASPWAERIGWTVVLDGPGVEQITTSALPSRRLKLAVEGPGGHSWSNLGRASAVHAAIRIGAALLAQVQPQADALGCNIGLIQGGSAVNAIAAEAWFKLDLRAHTAAGLDDLTQAARRALATGVEQENAAALAGAVRARWEVIGERPGGTLASDAPLLQLLRRVDQELGIAAIADTASTDANIPLAQRRQALRVGAGGQGGGTHTLQEWYEPTGRSLALERVLLLVLTLAAAAPPARPLRA